MIDSNEIKIIGNWTFNGQKMIEDEQCERIYSLRDNYLRRITSDESGWDVLYQDPVDMRYWELIYEHSELQGGGPPSLLLMSEAEARSKYNI
jgi:hypothetical protein